MFSDLRKANRLGMELAGDWNPAAQMRDGTARMNQMVEQLNRQADAGSVLPEVVAAHAIVLNAAPTGTIINLDQVLSINLLITVDGQPPIPTRTSVPVPVTEIAGLRPGQEIDVMVNPAPPHQVVMPWAIRHLAT